MAIEGTQRRAEVTRCSEACWPILNFSAGVSIKYGPLSLLHCFSIAELTRALAFVIAEEGTSLLNEPFGSGKSSLSAAFEVRRKYFKIDIFKTRGWSRAHKCALICFAYQKIGG